MPRGDKDKYTDKQKRQAEHIEEGYKAKGLSEREAERRAWATVNAVHHGGEKPGGGGYGKAEDREPMRKGARKAAKTRSKTLELRRPAADHCKACEESGHDEQKEVRLEVQQDERDDAVDHIGGRNGPDRGANRGITPGEPAGCPHKDQAEREHRDRSKYHPAARPLMRSAGALICRNASACAFHPRMPCAPGSRT